MAPMPKRIVEDEPKKAAYVTFLAGSGDYWMGVVGLAKGLRAVNSAYPLVVAVLPDVPMDHRRKLVEQGCLVREIVPVYLPDSQTQFAMAYYVINYSKLRIWEMLTDSLPENGHTPTAKAMPTAAVGLVRDMPTAQSWPSA
ncbi:unnamed protein product [Triticum turgidum subsp. durum]|uniref:Hexosyltransferase n=1 Tax=Triticum turgidum subsp. durum TaxID=4567 RepID=A0A9R1R2R1_TRITD|nr:unnamed protein product [Triticum turgidum subsp. durum]